MKAISTKLLVVFTFLFSILGYTTPISAQEFACYGQQMYVDLTYSPAEVKQGEYVTFTATVRNCTYKETYDEDDFKLTNPGAQVQHSSYKQYLEPSTDWIIPVPSMEDKEVLTFTTTYRIKENTPTGYFGGNSVVRWLDKNDSDTMDHVTQGRAPLKILAKDSGSGNEVQTNTQNEGEEQQLRITLHERFLSQNSTTTRIDQMSDEELKEVENFTLEEVGKNKVAFKNTLDFSSDETIEKLNNLSEYTDLSLAGKVEIDTDYLTMFDKPATVTMYGLTFEETPLIYKDGALATEDEVSNINYDYSQEEGGTLTFEVSSFSTYEAKERTSNEQQTTQVTQEARKDFSLYWLLGIIALITTTGIVVAVIYKRREKKTSRQDKKETEKKVEKKKESKKKE